MLSICSNLFSGLNTAEIPYCHWKSNEHLEAGLNGNTDLDIITDRNNKQHIKKILNKTGFKHFDNAAFNSHPATEDYLGFDKETGEIIHIHLHYRLILGGSLKQYHVPWTNRILETRQLDDENDVYVTNPNLELLLLFVRYALKLTRRDHLRSMFGVVYPEENIQQEYEWLQRRIDYDIVTDLSQELISPEASTTVEKLLDGMSVPKFRELRKIVRKEFEIYRTFSRSESWFQRRRRAFLKKLRWHSREDLGHPRLFERTVPSGGLIVAIVGPDGAGKSTATSEIVEWLSWKLDVYQIYMGSNDTYSIPRQLLQFGRQIYTAIAGEPNPSNPDYSSRSKSVNEAVSNNSDNSSKSIPGRVWDVSNALLISYEKRKKLKRVWRARNKGAVVITDRFPQNDVMGINDGPLLANLSDHPSKSRRVLSNWERKPYEWAEENSADLVIKLMIDPKTAIERDPEANPNQIHKKCDIVQSLSFGDAKVVRINANNSKEKVIDEIRRTVWEEL